MPNITIAEFFKILGGFCVAIKFDKFRKCITLEPRKEILKKKVSSDWSLLQCNNSTVCINKNDGFNFKYVTKNNEPKPQDDETYQVGNGSDDVNLNLSPLYNTTRYDPNYITGLRTWLTGCTYIKSSTEGYDIGISDFGAMLFFYHGFQSDSNGDLYPLGTSQNTNFVGDILCQWSLNLSSIYMFWWKDWLNIIGEKDKFDFSIIPNVKTVGAYDHCNFYELTEENQRVCFFVEKMSVAANCDGLLESNVTAQII